MLILVLNLLIIQIQVFGLHMVKLVEQVLVQDMVVLEEAELLELVVLVVLFLLEELLVEMQLLFLFFPDQV